QVNHLRLAESMAHPPRKSLIPRNGDVVEIGKDDIKVVGQVDAGIVLIDSVGEVTEPVIRDRQTLSEEGVIVIMALASKKGPTVEVITRGVVQGQNGLVKEIERIAQESLQKGLREK